MPAPDAPKAPPPARLLDLTRLFSRIGRGPWTGVDRVELAYLEALLESPTPLFALVSTRRGFILLGRAATARFHDRLRRRAPRVGAGGRPNWARFATEARLRRSALARCSSRKLATCLARHLPPGTVLLNVGHSDLATSVFEAIKALPGGRIGVLIHDMIPLDHPQYQAAGRVAPFEAKMRRVARYADLIICNSEVTRADTERHFSTFGRVPAMIVAPIGVEARIADPAALPQGLDLARPYFVALGTLEPRKNHALLLDVWEHFAATMPEADIPALYLVGTRGWANEALFARLDASPLRGRHLFELASLSDGAVAALLGSARALLMPSHAEGFGLPPAEALALGTPAIVNPLPVYWEILGNNPIYADVGDMYLWATKILELARADPAEEKAAARGALRLPTWQEHFNLVLKVT